MAETVHYNSDIVYVWTVGSKYSLFIRAYRFYSTAILSEQNKLYNNYFIVRTSLKKKSFGGSNQKSLYVIFIFTLGKLCYLEK